MGSYDDPLVPIIQGTDQNLINELQYMLNQLARAIAEHDAHIAGQLNLAINSAVGEARDYLDIKLGTVLRIVSEISDSMSGLEGLLSNSAGASLEEIEGIASVILGEVDYQAGQTNDLINGISNTLGNFVEGITESIESNRRISEESINDMLGEYFDTAGKSLTNMEDSIKDSLDITSADIKDKLGIIQQENYDNLNAVDADIKAALGELSGSIQTTISTIPGEVASSIGNFMEAVQWLWSRFLEWDEENRNITPDKLVTDYMNIANANKQALRTLISE